MRLIHCLPGMSQCRRDLRSEPSIASVCHQLLRLTNWSSSLPKRCDHGVGKRMAPADRLRVFDSGQTVLSRGAVAHCDVHVSPF